MSKPEHHYYVYIVASRSHILYIGITNNIQRRVEQHRNAELPGFTAMYRCARKSFSEKYLTLAIELSSRPELRRSAVEGPAV